jgi:succinoglycan biosynthesis transport protein ExoP
MFIDSKQTATIANAQPVPQASAQGPAINGPAIDVGYLVEVLWNRRRSVLLPVGVCMFAALLFGLFAPARFTASMQILIDPNDLRVVENVLRGQNQLTETHITQVENQVRVLLSNNVAKRVVDRLHLDRDPDFTGSGATIFDPRATIRALFGARSATKPDPALDALNALKKRIRSKRVDRTYVVDTSVWADSPQRSVEIANALLDSFMEEQSAGRADAARRVFTSLNARLAELRERVQQAEQRVEDYKKAHNLLSSSGTLVNERQLTELNSQLVLASTRTAEAKARYDKIMEARRGRADPGAIGEAVGSATITALRTQLGEIARREGEINATLGKRHPAVIEIESQALRIRRMIEEEVTRIAEAARNDMERAQANEKSLAASLERLKTELEDTNDAGVRLRELERDVGASRSVYEAYLVRTREVSEQERLDTSNIRVIATPDLPETRSFPPRTLIMLAAGGMLGGLLGVVLAFFGEWRARRWGTLPPAAPEPAPALVSTLAPYAPAPAVAPVVAPPVVASSVVASPAVVPPIAASPTVASLVVTSPRESSPPLAPVAERAQPSAPATVEATPAPAPRKQAFRL